MTEFQRDKCFTFFGTFEAMLMEIGEVEGETTELKCRRALSQYALHGETSADKKINMLLMGIYPTIDYSQGRRADGFKRGRPREYDHEEINHMRKEGRTLNEIARETGASRSTVKRALKRHDNDNEYDNDIDSDTEHDNDVDNASEYESEKENDHEVEYENDYEYNTDNDSKVINPYEPYEPFRDREYEDIMREGGI
mgnify:CR=1 FL=1